MTRLLLLLLDVDDSGDEGDDGVLLVVLVGELVLKILLELADDWINVDIEEVELDRIEEEPSPLPRGTRIGGKTGFSTFW